MASYYSGPTLTREQAAQVLSQAGVSGEDLVFLVAVAERESGYVAGAHRTDSPRDRLSGDRGLWQINYTWDNELRNAGIIGQPSDLFDPLTNAKAAAYVLGKQGKAAWGMGSNGWAAGGDPNKGINIPAARAAVDRATSQGLIGKDWSTMASNTTGGQLTSLPRDARVVQNLGDGSYRIVFMAMPGVSIQYNTNAQTLAGMGFDLNQVERISATGYIAKYGSSVNGGDASELAEIPTAFGTYGNYLNAIMDQLFPKGDPRRNDREVMRVLATRAGRPDMSEAEFENLLKATKYYQTRTEGELRWNDLSEAQRQSERRDADARISQIWLQHVGRQFTAAERKNIGHWVELVASGKMGYGQFTDQIVKPLAERYPETPWSRQLREEKEAQRQRPVDIENTMIQVRDLLTRWGLSWSGPTIRSWAQGLVEKTKSDEDLLNTVKQNAQVLFPWKDPEMETVVAAAPWIETYNRVLERQGSLQTPEIARTLSAYGRDPDNNDVWSFEQKLKMSDQYDQTRQGQDDAYSTANELAGLMGF